MGKKLLPCKMHEPLLFQFTPLDSHFHTLSWRAWLHLLSYIPIGSRGLLSGPSEPSFPQSEQDQIPQLVHIWHVFQLPCISFCHFIIINYYYYKVSRTTWKWWPLSRQTSYTGSKRRNSDCSSTPVKHFSCIKEGRTCCTSHPSKQCPVTPIPSIQVFSPNPAFWHHTSLQERRMYGVAQPWSLVFSCKTKSKHGIPADIFEQRTEPRIKHMGLGGHSHFKHSSVKILITLENKNSSTESKRKKSHF